MRDRFAILTILAAAMLFVAAPTVAQEPSEPVPEPTVEGALAAAVQALTDSITDAQGGQAGVDAAMAEAAAAETAWEAAQQGVVDATASRDGAHGTVLAGIDALEEALAALRAAYTPGG